MRWMILLLLISCSQTPLKYKYSGAKRYLASLTSEETEVARIEGEFQDPLIFASGLDSTFLLVKLYDSQGNQLRDVDPNDLVLYSSEDIDAKPFSFSNKLGLYRAEILPHFKSKNILMKVDWQERKMSRQLELKTTIAPLKDEMQVLKNKNYQTYQIGYGNAVSYPTDGFSFSNDGDNRIVKSSKDDSQRVFNFDYPEQAGQNLSLEVYDAPNGTVSHTMHSIFWFFPRVNLHLVKQTDTAINVTLPTGEKVTFDKETKEITGGVLKEGPLDTSKDRFKRTYPDLEYTGRGVVLRVNARGQSPQLGQFENNKIDMEYGKTGSVDVLIINGTTGEKCRRPKSDFWEQIDVSPILFKFPNDEEFDLYLRNNCGFGLPKF